MNGSATIRTGNVLNLNAAALSSPATLTFANNPTLNVQNNLTITNYLFQGTGFTLGSGSPYVSSPGLSQTGMTTSVTLGPGSSLTYDVGTLSTAGSFEFGQQAITLNGGTFAATLPSAQATLTNAINVPAAGGTIAFYNGWTGSSAVFSGQVNLAGPLNIYDVAGNGNLSLAGPIVVNQSAPGVRGFSSPAYTNIGTISGVISDGPGTYHNPVVFSPKYIIGGWNPVPNVTNVNSYSGGTIVDSCPTTPRKAPRAALIVAPAATLGSGNLTVLPGGSVILQGGLGNLGASATIYRANSSSEAAVVNVGGAMFPAAASSLAPNAAGVLALEGNHSETINMATGGQRQHVLRLAGRRG